MNEKKNSDARIKANNKYNAKAYDRINIAIPKGEKDLFSDHAQSKGESLNAFASRALHETMKRDKATGGV